MLLLSAIVKISPLAKKCLVSYYIVHTCEMLCLLCLFACVIREGRLVFTPPVPLEMPVVNWSEGRVHSRGP
jgi:hypothetical protein